MGRVFSDRSFLKILIFSTDNGRFSAGGTIWPPPIGNRVKDITKKLRPGTLQIKYEGMLSIVKTAELEKIGELWIKLLYSLGEKKAIDYTLMLYHYEQISLRMVKRIISRSFCG